MPRKSKTAGKRIVAKQRQIKALALRVKGYSLSRIGEELGITGAGVDKALRRAIAELNERSDDAVQEYRTVAGEQIDAIMAGHWAAGTEGEVGQDGVIRASPQSARVLLDCLTRKAKLFGLDAPAKIETTDQAAMEYMRLVSAGADELERKNRLAVTVESEPVPPVALIEKGSDDV